MNPPRLFQVQRGASSSRPRVNYQDRVAGVAVEVRDARLELERRLQRALSGQLSAPDVSIRTARNETRFSKLEGKLEFDGTVLGIEDLALHAPEGSMRVDGTLPLLPAFDLSGLQYRGQLDLSRVAPWIGADPAPSGVVAFSGTATGPIERVTATIDVAGGDLRWSRSALRIGLSASPCSRVAVAIESLRRPSPAASSTHRTSPPRQRLSRERRLTGRTCVVRLAARCHARDEIGSRRTDPHRSTDRPSALTAAARSRHPDGEPTYRGDFRGRATHACAQRL